MITNPNDATLAYGSSLRAISVEATLQRAASRAERYGIARVTNTTYLDRVGIPVYASVRPRAQQGSLCVNAGKGLTETEACVGAYMEAIEFAHAEWGASDLEVVYAKPEDVLDGRTRPEAILDLCPFIGASIPTDVALACVAAEEILANNRVLLPAELVFLPMPTHLATPAYFGASSTGLCSGNTLLEATVHGLAECIERDINSFHHMNDCSQLIRNDSLPPQAAALVDKVRAAGLEIYVRYQSNPYNIPWIFAQIHDPECTTPLFLNGGYGCHPHAGIAVVRAICEAAQCRLSVIHGGRDDLINAHRNYAALSRDQITGFVAHRLMRARNATGAISFAQMPDHTAQTRTLQEAFDFMVQAIARAGMRRICRVAYTAPDDELQVARIVVPGMEYFMDSSRRVGRRLRDYVQRLR